MYPPPSSRSAFPSAPRRSSASGDAPLTAERAMMDQIRSKLERAQRRLAHSSPHSSSSSSSSRYIPSSEYNSAMHKPPVTSVLMEDLPATASKHYSSRAPPPSSRIPPPSSRYGGMPPPPPSTLRHHGMPPPPSSRRPPSSKYDSSRYANQQYKSRSKYAKNEDSDPLNGGPPPMSTPYLVYSSSRPMTGSHHSTSSRTPVSKTPSMEEKVRQRVPPSSKYSNMNGPPSAMRSGVPKPPSSRVRFEGHETELRESIEKFERDSEAERKRLHQHMKEREARHQRHREQEMKNVNARAKGSGPTSPIAAASRGRRSTSLEKPPNSAIKLSAYEDIAQAIPTSPVGRPRRSSINNPPPKSDIKASAFEDLIPRRRTSAAQDNPPEPSEPAQPEDDAVAKDEVTVVNDAVVKASEPAAVTDAEQELSSQSDNQEPVEPAALPPPMVKSPPSSVVPEHDNFSSSDEEDNGDMSGFESDDSYMMYSDSDAELSSGYSMFDTLSVPEHQIVYEEATDSDNSDDEAPTSEPNVGNQTTEPEENDSVPSPPASELSTVKEEEPEEPQPASRSMTARDLAFMALGRASTSSLSDLGSPVSSVNGKESPRSSMVPMSYTPASSAFPPSRALGRPPMPATTGRTRNRVPPPSSTMSSYVPRSRTRAPMDLKNQLPPSIGILSGLSSGSSTFVMDPASFYEVTWKTGEFAFSVQRVYTEENEFDDRNQEPQLFLRMLLNTERSTCKSFRDVRLGDVLIRVGDNYVSDLGLEGSGTVLTKFFARLMGQTPIKLTFQRMYPSDWEGGVEL